MAIKVLAVSGAKRLEDEIATQDFIMINHPVFFVNDPNRYMSFMQDINSDRFFRKLHIPFALGSKGTRIALNLRTTVVNPLQTRYWFMVPYQLGIGPDRQAVKYSARSCTAAVDPIPNHPKHSFYNFGFLSICHSHQDWHNRERLKGYFDIANGQFYGYCSTQSRINDQQFV